MFYSPFAVSCTTDLDTSQRTAETPLKQKTQRIRDELEAGLDSLTLTKNKSTKCTVKVGF